MPTRKISAAPGALQVITLEEAKANCRVFCADEDGLLTSFISIATAAASDRLQRALVPTLYRLTVDEFPPALLLEFPPITSVQSVKYFDPSGMQQTLDPQDYYLDSVSEPGYLVPASGRGWPDTQDRINAVEVEYTAGYPAGTLPEPIKQWILLAIGDLYENRTRSAEKPAVPQHFAESLLDTAIIYRGVFG